MPTAPRRVYDTDVTMKTLTKHLDAPTLRTLMEMEVKGNLFDWCVEELYRDVTYDVVRDMTREDSRQIKCLDAVQTIDIPTRFTLHELEYFRVRLDRVRDIWDHHRINELRRKCPNLRLVTRQRPSVRQQTFTITLTPGEETGEAHIHHPLLFDVRDVLDNVGFPRPHASPMDRKLYWPDWELKETCGLLFRPTLERHPETARTIRASLPEVDRLDKAYSAINTTDFVVELSLLGDIAKSRHPDKNPITSIIAVVEPFTLDQFTTFVTEAGADLTQLDLTPDTQAGSKLTLLDLPRLVTLILKHCPRLVFLGLTLDTTLDGVEIDDRDVDPPDSDIPFASGNLGTLVFYLQNTPFRDTTLKAASRAAQRMVSFNIARNLACVAGHDCSVSLTDPILNTNHAFREAGSCGGSFALEWLPEVSRAVAFFHRLGPVLEPHFRPASLEHLGLKSLKRLKELRYKTDGTPLTLQESRQITRSKLRTSLEPTWTPKVVDE